MSKLAHSLCLVCFVSACGGEEARTNAPEPASGMPGNAESPANAQMTEPVGSAATVTSGAMKAANTPAAGAVSGRAAPSGGSGVTPTTPRGASAVSGNAGAAATMQAASSGSGGSGAPLTAGASSAVPAAGSGGSAGATPMLGQDCANDPLANERAYGSGFFQQFRGLMGCTAATNLTLYREMLPAKFEMPADPQVCFYTLDFMISGVGPYHESALLLPIEYKGAPGKYVLTMGLDNAAATSGGRAVGFPKYMCDVTFTQSGNDWTATVGDEATPDLHVAYTNECVAEDTFLWPDFINLTPIPVGETSSEAFLPPRDGSALMVPAEHLTDPKFYSLRGSILLSIGDHVPWNGLIDETKPFIGYLTTFKGGIDLGNRPLD